MATITIKNIPADIYEKLKRSAQLRHRSINREVIACIEQSVGSQPLNPDLLLANARRLRAKTASKPITDIELNQAKAAGRL